MSHPLSPYLPPVTRFLLEELCLRDPSAPGPGLPCSAEELATEARRQCVVGLLSRWAAQGPRVPLSSALRPLLAASLQRDAVHALALVQEALAIAGLFEREQIAVLFLKGPFLSKRYHGDFGIRHAGDLDVLVEEADVRRADAVLRGSGYARTKPVRELSPRRWQLYLDTQHELGYRPAGKEMLVELHWRYADARRLAPYPFAELHARSRAEDVAGLAIRTLSDRDTFVQLAVHGALDGWSRLKWFADLPRMLERLSAPDLRAIDAEARSLGHHRIVTLALAMAGAAEPPAWIDELLPRILRRLRDAGQSRTWSVALQDRRYLRALADNPGMREAIAYSTLIMPDDFDALRMPDRLTPMLPYAAQARRAWRKLAR